MFESNSLRLNLFYMHHFIMSMYVVSQTLKLLQNCLTCTWDSTDSLQSYWLLLVKFAYLKFLSFCRVTCFNILPCEHLALLVSQLSNCWHLYVNEFVFFDWFLIIWLFLTYSVMSAVEKGVHILIEDNCFVSRGVWLSIKIKVYVLVEVGDC